MNIIRQLFSGRAKKRKPELCFLITLTVLLLSCFMHISAEASEPDRFSVVSKEQKERITQEPGAYYIGSRISPYLFFCETDLILPENETADPEEDIAALEEDTAEKDDESISEDEAEKTPDITKSLGLAVPGSLTAYIQLTYDPDGYAILTLPQNGTVLGIESAPADGLPVLQLPEEYTRKPEEGLSGVHVTTQRWISESAGDGYFLLRSAADPAYVITAEISGTSTPEAIVLQTENGEYTQQFRFTYESPRLEEQVTENMSFLASGLDQSMLLSIGDGIYNDTRNIYIYIADNGDGQFFRIYYDNYGLAFIHHNRSNKVLTVRNGSAAVWQEVGQCEKDWSNNQRWIIEPSGNGGYYIRSALDINMVLDVVTGELVNSSPVQLYPFEGDSSQEWFFSDVPSWLLRDQVYMDSLVNQYYSDTEYLLMIDNVSNHVGVYKEGAYGWENLYYWNCVTGKESTPTVKGEFTVFNKSYSFDGNTDSPEWYTCYYATEWHPSYFFHSIIYYQGTWDIMDASMGCNASHGCVRMDTENAKWIYENIPLKTKVVSY